MLDAAERLLRDGEADFSMRDLAAEAGVSFATPFNQFRSKAAIMHALSGHRIDTMTTRFGEARQPADTAGRIIVGVRTAVAVMLEEPAVNRAVMGWIGTANAARGDALTRSTAFWVLALGSGEDVPEERRARMLGDLPRQLALAFRGTLSFWTAGELSDAALGPTALAVADTLLLAFTGRSYPPTDAPDALEASPA